MINSLKNNKSLLRRKRMFSKDRSFLNLKREYLKAAEGKINIKKATKEELRAIRVKVIKEKKKASYITIAAFIISFILIGFLGYLIIDINNSTEAINNKVVFNKKEKKYLELIADGDNWLSDRKWHNAIFQYKEAQELFPKEFAINYRLVSAYCYRCESDFKDCEKAKEFLESLLLKYPNKPELLKLKEILEYEY